LRDAGVRLSDRSYNSPDFARLNCEPIGASPVLSARPTIPDQIDAALRAAPDGMTAVALGEKLERSRQTIFAGLGHLMRANRVTKHGTVYRAQQEGA
jgi:hypothetical protein